MATKLNVGNCKEADEFGVEDDGEIVPIKEDELEDGIVVEEEESKEVDGAIAVTDNFMPFEQWLGTEQMQQVVPI